MLYNVFRFQEGYSIVMAYLAAGFSALGYRNSRNSGWLLLIVAPFSTVVRGSYNFMENAILINYFPKPQPLFTYWDYFSRALFIIGIAKLALQYHEVKEEGAVSVKEISIRQTFASGWVLPSVLLVISLTIVQILFGSYYIFAALQTVGMALSLLYISLCLVLARRYVEKRALVRFSSRLYPLLLIAGVLIWLLRKRV